MDTLLGVTQSNHTSGPYPKSVKVLIVETKTEGDVLMAGIADETQAAKLLCYEKKHFPKLIENKTVLMRNFQKGRSSVIINKSSKILPATPLNNISESDIIQARHIVNPPPPQLVPLKDIRLPQPGIMIPLITVKGEVVQDEVPRTIPNGQLVRNIKLKEGSIIRPVALWNKATTSPIKTGDIVTFSHVSPKKDKFLKELSLSTTSRTNITIETTPEKFTTGHVIAAEEEESEIALTVQLSSNDDLEQFILSQDLSAELFESKNIEDVLESFGDKLFKFTIQGKTIVQLTDEIDTNKPSTSK
ncbi:hypothetical protein BSL78_09809 [Apostichopus japonicus]|uniref:Uncharacterized protein n=1 Tax=Stichopus japonicus TaxID=307972 RepID=A0A2G8KZ61_STIJA|nr:hypothetical protein BSL78_09809 [Apostichopus japonicus]